MAAVYALRGAAGSALGQAVRDTMWLIARGQRPEFLLPAGPWQRPYAAALEYLRQCGASPVTAESDPAALRAQLLRTLSHERVLGILSVDRVDLESLELFAGLAAVTTAMRAAGSGSGLQIVAGTTVIEPAPAARSLLDFSTGGIHEVSASAPQGSPVLDHACRQVLALLAVADAPLTLNAFEGITEDTAGLLQRLEAIGLVHVGDTVGQGTGFARIEFTDHELNQARRILVSKADSGVDALRAGLQLLAHGEYLAAARLLRPLAATGGVGIELAYALALGESGHPDAPMAIFEHMQRLRLAAPDEMLMGRLAASLHRHGRVPAEVAEARLRRAERALRESDSAAALALRAARASLLVTRGDAGRAATLLRRISRDVVTASPRETRSQWQVALGLVLGATGNPEGAAAAAALARELAASPREAMQVVQLRRQLATRRVPGNETRRADSTALDVDEFVTAAQLLDAPAIVAATQRLTDAQTLRAAVTRTLLMANPTDEPPPGAQPAATFRWFARRGATLAAMIHQGELHVFPPEASGRPSLVSWLKGRLRQLELTTDAQLHEVSGLASHGWLGAELLLCARRLGRHGPLLVAARAGSDPTSLLAAFDRASGPAPT